MLIIRMLPATSSFASTTELTNMVDALEKRAAAGRILGLGKKLTGMVGAAATKAKSFIPGMRAKPAPAVNPWTTATETLRQGMLPVRSAPAGGFLARNMNKIMGGTMLGNLGIQTADQLGSFSNPIRARQEGAVEALSSLAGLPAWQRLGFAAAPEAALKYRLSTTPTGWMDSFKKRFEDPVTAATINRLRAPGTPAPYHGVSQFFGPQQAGLTNDLSSLAAENEKLRAMLASAPQ